jgi:hypothetical protein
MNQLAVLGTATIDLIVFAAIFGMMLTKMRPKQDGAGGHTGNWAPGIVYLPVMLIRWAIVPHKDWVSEHRQRQMAVENQMHHHHHHGIHHNPHS